MNNNFSMVMTDLALGGGLTGDPPVLHCVEDFLNKASNLEKVDQLLQEDGCVLNYESLIDCLLVELRPKFEEPCREFYEGNGKSLAKLYPTSTIQTIDAELVTDLEILISKEWPTWGDFKSNLKTEKESRSFGWTRKLFGVVRRFRNLFFSKRIDQNTES